MKINFNGKKKYQIIFVAIILVICLGVIYILNNKKVNNPEAVIYKNGEVVKRIDLSNIKESYEFTIEDGEHFNTIKVDEEGVSIVEASCTDKVCIERGSIKDELLPITCIPNKIIIKIQEAEESSIDSVVY